MNSIYLNHLLMGLLGSEKLITTWWTTPNKAFDNKCPKDVDIATVTNYIEGYCLG